MLALSRSRVTLLAMRINASQAQAAYDIPRMTIGRWISSGKLAADVDGYFEEEDLAALNAKRLTQTAPGRKAKPKAKPPAKKPPVKKEQPSAPKKKAAARKTKPTAKKKTPAKKAAARKAKPSKAKGTLRKTPATAESATDPLYDEAVKLCVTSGKYTITSLQRQLKIGYNRAARLLELILEPEIEETPDAPKEAPLPPANSRQGIDLRKATALAKKAEVEVQVKMKDLISRELVSRIFRKLYMIDSTQWRGLGPRLAPDLMAVCKVEDPTKEVEISDRIEREVFRTLGHVQRAMNEFLEEIESEDRIGDE